MPAASVCKRKRPHPLRFRAPLRVGAAPRTRNPRPEAESDGSASAVIQEVVMRAVRWLVGVAGCGVALAAGAVEGNGLVLRGPAPTAAHAGGVAASALRGRFAIGLDAPTAGWVPADAPAASPSIVGARLLGDYYFSRPGALDGRVSGFRATSGVLLGPRLGAWAAVPATPGAATVSVERRDFGLLPGTAEAGRRLDGGVTVPYVGMGYSNAFGQGRWGFRQIWG